jgi:hypothetical protein
VPIVVKPFTDEHIPAVREFNKRIEAGGVSSRFPESPTPQWLPYRDSSPVYQEYFVALEGETVRGAYILKPQAFSCNDELTMIADYQLPISEGIVDSRYTLVGLSILTDALKRQPLLFALGMGGYQENLVRMLKTMKWSLVSCPFYFKVNHPFRFLREIVFLRHKRRAMRMMLDALAFSGLGWMAIKSLQSVKRLTHRAAADVACEEVPTFSSWADEIWKRSHGNYAMIALRDTVVLNTLYPGCDERFRRVRVLRRGEVIGWAVALTTKMKEHKHFGDMRVGSVVDCLALPGEEHPVIATVTRHLEGLGVDIIVTNQLHSSWCTAFAKGGYLSGPSNFIFAVSREVAKKLHPFHLKVSEVHMTRGDGDGPIHL